MFFHFIHVSTLHEKQSLNKHNSHLENDYKTYAAMTIHISNSLETSAVRRLHQEGQNYVQYLSIRQSLAETLYNCRSFLRCITGLKQTKEKTAFEASCSVCTVDVFVAPCLGIRIPECGKLLPVESWTRKIFLVESGIPGFNPAPQFRNPQLGIQNPRLSRIPLHGAILVSFSLVVLS